MGDGPSDGSARGRSMSGACCSEVHVLVANAKSTGVEKYGFGMCRNDSGDDGGGRIGRLGAAVDGNSDKSAHGGGMDGASCFKVGTPFAVV